MNWTKIGSNAAGWASGLNWWKLGAWALALALIVGTSFTYGKHKAELVCEKDKTELAEKQTKAIVDFTNVRSVETRIVEVKSEKIKEAVRSAGERLDEELSRKVDVPECRLTDIEYGVFNELAEQTRSK